MAVNNVVFVVENNYLHEQLIKENFQEEHKHVIKYFRSSADCLSHLDQHPMAVLIDHDLKTLDNKERDALRILEKIKELDQHTQVVFFSETENKQVAQDMLTHGAFDYVTVGPNSYLRLQKVLSNIEATNRHKTDAKRYRLLTWISLLLYVAIMLFIAYLYIKGYIRDQPGDLMEP